jgi:hypothetical protein
MYLTCGAAGVELCQTYPDALALSQPYISQGSIPRISRTCFRPPSSQIEKEMRKLIKGENKHKQYRNVSRFLQNENDNINGLSIE